MADAGSNLAETLWRRAMVYLREAKRLYAENHYDVALVMAEQAAQLGVKAIYARLLGRVPRGHSLRRLLGYLASVLEDANRREEALRLRGFVVDNRETLLLLEDAYVQGRYQPVDYTRSEAERGIDMVKHLLALLEELLED